MSTHAAAHGIASLGRYGDTTLVHVAPKEIAGLEALTGRKMTINPHTGMREAFGWADIIPIVAGVAGTVVGGPLAGAAAAGVAKTGVSSAQGNDFGTALQSGLITGATAYAGGQALSGIGEAANVAQAAGSEALTQGVTGAATDTAAQAATGVATDSAGQLATQGATDASTQGLGSLAGQPGPVVAEGGVTGLAPPPAPVAPPGVAPGMAPAGATPGMAPPTGGEPLAAGPVTPDAASYGPQVGDAAANAPVTPQVQGPPVPSNVAYANQSYADQAADVGRGLTDPKIVGKYVADHPMQAAVAAGGVYQTYADATAKPNTTPAIAPIRGPTLAPLNRQAMMPGQGYSAGHAQENRYFAEGGLVTVGQDNDWAKIMQAMTGASAGMGAAAAANPQRTAVMPPEGYDAGKSGAWNYFPPAAQTAAPDYAGMMAAYQAQQSAAPAAPPPDNMNGQGAKAGGPIRGVLEHRGIANLKPRNMPSHGETMDLVGRAKAALEGKGDNPGLALERFSKRFGPHALSGLKRDMQRYAAGGDVARPMSAPSGIMSVPRAVEGPGGGLDDAVPAMVDGELPARLSDGEFVIPADVVSGLGDGSTKAGIARLHAMMDRIRQHDGGGKKQPGPMPESVMPA